MATRMKMLKLLQEMRGLTSFSNRRPQARPTTTTALVLPLRGFRTPVRPKKQIIRINIHQPPDIPAPVKIIFLHSASAAAQTVATVGARVPDPATE